MYNSFDGGTIRGDDPIKGCSRYAVQMVTSCVERKPDKRPSGYPPYVWPTVIRRGLSEAENI
ncbi:hypothetical protein RRF57_008710 [Xylaria bambusicola]|uniref:Uncharacterized protein n=1 Tax=Xylaria bambusicola TaxID=326684 RepID=A0AAN7UVS7_9PEZI